MNVSLECKDKSIGVLFNNKTGDDLYCHITRENLGLLEVQEDRLFDFCLNPPTKTVENDTKQRESDRENRRYRAITSIVKNCGNVTKGTNVNRLYSPWAVAPTEIRPLFKFCGTEMVHFDLQASQPTLIADYCGDDSFLEACYSDALYTQVAELLELDDGTLTTREVRKLAKKKFLAYCYGNIRKSTARNKEALAVQEFVEVEYPIAGAYIRSQKKGDYRTLNRKLQNREAAIFLKTIFAELIRRDIPALTVHDCVYCRDTDSSMVEEIMKSVLSQSLKKHKLIKKANRNEEKKLIGNCGGMESVEGVLTHLVV